MMHRMLSRRGGFTLIELLIVIAIIGLIAAMLIPNMLQTMTKAKQKRTMADERLVGTAFMAWLSDEASAAAAGAATFSLGDYQPRNIADVEAQLIPLYIQKIPTIDGFGYSYEYRFTTDVGEDQVMAIRSVGADGRADGESYTIGGFRPTDFDRDIVWADGFFVSWPAGLDATRAGS